MTSKKLRQETKASTIKINLE